MHKKHTCKYYIDVIPVQVFFLLQTNASMFWQTKNVIFYVSWLTPTEHLITTFRTAAHVKTYLFSSQLRN